MKRYRPRPSNGRWEIVDRISLEVILNGQKKFILRHCKALNEGRFD